jgi:hypothetical protein
MFQSPNMMQANGVGGYIPKTDAECQTKMTLLMEPHASLANQLELA